MSWTPISGTIPQYQTSTGDLASGYYIKFYQSGTTTAFNMATDSGGGTTLDKSQLDSSGYPTTDGSTRFIPHVNQDYKIVLYKNSTDADNNTTANADWVIDALKPVLSAANSEVIFETVADMVASTTLNVGDHVKTLGYLAIGDGGGNEYDVVSAATGTDDGGSFIDLATHQAKGLFPGKRYSLRQWGASLNDSDDDTTHLQSAINFAAGDPIYIDATAAMASSITGTVDVDLYGPGKLNATADIFATNGSIKLRDGIIITTTGNVVASTNIATFIDFTFDHVCFSACTGIIDYKIAGTGDYDLTNGIRTLNVTHCEFLSCSNIGFELNCPITEAIFDSNYFKEQIYACVYIIGDTQGRQPQKQNIVFSNNVINQVRQNISSDTATAGFVAFAQRISVTGNVMDNIRTTVSGPEVWGVYTKSRYVTVTGNVMSNFSGSTTSTMFVNTKGSKLGSATTGGGLFSTVSGNLFYNDPSEDNFAIGVHMYSDLSLAAGNNMYGVALPFDQDGSSDSTRNDIIGNVATAPPASYKDKAVDWRISAGSYKIAQNVFDGWTDGIRLKTNASNVDLVELIDNTVVTTADAFLLEDATLAGSLITKLIIRGGLAEGANLLRVNQAVVDYLHISDIDVSGITNKYLINAGNKYLKNGSIRNLVNHTVTGSAGNESMLFLAPVNDTFVSINARLTACTSGVAEWAHVEIRDQWANDGGTVARKGSETVIHDQKSASADIQVTNSGDIIIVQVVKTAATGKHVVDFDVEFINYA